MSQNSFNLVTELNWWHHRTHLMMSLNPNDNAIQHIEERHAVLNYVVGRNLSRFSAASSDKSLTSKESHQQGISPKPGARSGSQRSSASTPNPPFKRKVFQIEPEPRHEVVEGSNRDVEIYYSAISDYCKFKLQSENGTDIHFKDTLMFQSRVYGLVNDFFVNSVNFG